MLLECHPSPRPTPPPPRPKRAERPLVLPPVGELSGVKRRMTFQTTAPYLP